MIANVLKRLHPPPPSPPAAAMCPAQEHVPSSTAPCPAPGVGTGCAAAASRRDGHLGQTELFIPFTSLKLQELRAAPRPHRAAHGAAAGGSASTRSAPHGPHAREGGQHGTAVPVPGWCASAHVHAPSMTATCQWRCEDKVPRERGGTATLPREA